MVNIVSPPQQSPTGRATNDTCRGEYASIIRYCYSSICAVCWDDRIIGLDNDRLKGQIIIGPEKPTHGATV